MTRIKDDGKVHLVNENLTSTQEKYLECIHRIIKKTSKAPTVRALAAAMGVELRAASWAIDALLKKGALERPMVMTPGPMRLTKKGLEWIGKAK